MVFGESFPDGAIVVKRDFTSSMYEVALRKYQKRYLFFE